MISMFLTCGMYLSFYFYVLPRASYGYIWCGFIPSMVWGFSNYFQLFRCRNLALNRMFSHIRGRLGGCQLRRCVYDPPYICMPPVYLYFPVHLYAPICLNTPIHLYAPYPLYIVCFPIFPICHGELGVHLYTSYVLWYFWGVSVHLSGILVPVITSICLSVHITHASCSPSLWVASLLDWVLIDVCYVSCCCSLCLKLLLQWLWLLLLQLLVSSGMSSLLSVVTMAPSLMGLPATSHQHDVVLPLPLIPRHSGSIVGLATVLQQQPPSQMPLQAYANYAMGPLQVAFSFLPPFVYFICLVSVLVYAFCFQVPCWMSYLPMGAQPLGFVPLQPFGAYPWQAYMQPGDCHLPTLAMHRVVAPSTVLSRVSLMLLNQLFPSHPNYIWAYNFGGLGSHPIPLPSLHDGEGSSFPGLVPSNDMVNSESAVGVKAVDSGVVIGYQIDEFTHTWSAQQFVACSHIYAGFTGNVS